MSNGQDDVKVTTGGCVGTAVKTQQQQRRSQHQMPRQNQIRDGNQLAVFDAVADLRFADDFAEYVARAEGGGSTYGLLRRHALAQTSLRIHRPTTRDKDDVNNTRVVVSRQRRSRSLVPPARHRSGEQIGSADTSLPNHKTLLQALCAQTQQRRQQQPTKNTGTLQVNTGECITGTTSKYTTGKYTPGEYTTGECTAD